MIGVEPKWLTTRQRDFTGGENRVASPDLLGSNQIYLGVNCLLSSDGSLETRKGKTRINTTSLGTGKVLSAFRWAREDGSKFLTVQHGTTLYNAAWDGVSTVSSFTAVKTGLAANVKVRGVVWKDNLILVNGIQNNFSFDGTTCTDVAGSPPKSTLIAVYASRLWINDISSPNLLRYSDLESHAVWDALNVIKFRSGDGDVLTALAPQQGGMVVFKQESMWTLYGSSIDNMRVTLLSELYGTVAPDAIIADGIFVGSDNLYRFSLSEVTPFPLTHRKYFQLLSPAQRNIVAAMYSPAIKCVIIALRDFRQICIDVQSGAIFTWSGLNAYSFSSATASGDDGSLIVGDATDGILYILNNLYDDAGISIPTDVQLGFTDLNNPRDKVFRAIRPDIEVMNPRNGYPSTASIIYNIDHVINELTQTNPLYNATMVWNDDVWDSKEWGPQAVAENNFIFHFSERGRYISVRATSETRIKIKGFELKYRLIGRTM